MAKAKPDPKLIKGWLRFYDAVAKDENYEREARIVNMLIPLMIDRLSEEDLAKLWKQAEDLVDTADRGQLN